MIFIYMNIIITSCYLINNNFLIEKANYTDIVVIFQEVILKKYVTIFSRQHSNCKVLLSIVMSCDVECIIIKYILHYFQELQTNLKLSQCIFQFILQH